MRHHNNLADAFLIQQEYNHSANILQIAFIIASYFLLTVKTRDKEVNPSAKLPIITLDFGPIVEISWTTVDC
jgi:hypothetical protein